MAAVTLISSSANRWRTCKSEHEVLNFILSCLIGLIRERLLCAWALFWGLGLPREPPLPARTNLQRGR